jgi:hypothetical protein
LTAAALLLLGARPVITCRFGPFDVDDIDALSDGNEGVTEREDVVGTEETDDDAADGDVGGVGRRDGCC